MGRVIHRLRPFLLGGLLLALPWAAVYAKNVKPDPDGLPPHQVEDLAYGDVLFYFFQDEYFESITRLLAARQLARIPHSRDEAELLLGGLYLSLGEHVEAGRIFQDLLNKNTTERVRNRAWFYLGKVWYQRGYLDESERALREVSDKIDPHINAERYMLLAQLMMQQGRYDDAITALSNWHGTPDWTAYAQYNLGIALVRKGRMPEAIGYLDRVGRMSVRGEEMLALRDKANLALGFALLQAQRPAEARPVLERVRLEGPYSSKALLGVGWADAGVGEFKRALGPWLALRKRDLLDSAVQESFLTVPYAYLQLSATGQAADYYNSAISSFDAEMKRIDDSIEEIRAGKLLDRLLTDDKNDTLTWLWQLQKLPDAPESRYLYQLLASNEFQEGLRNYRELNYMSRNLADWRENISAYDDMLDTRQEKYRQRVPKADAVLAATDLDALNHKRVDFESRINEIEKSNDVAALGTAGRTGDMGAVEAHRGVSRCASGRPGTCGHAREAPHAEGRHVLAPITKLQGQAVERAACSQGTRGRHQKYAKTSRTGEPGQGHRAGERWRLCGAGRRSCGSASMSCGNVWRKPRKSRIIYLQVLAIHELEAQKSAHRNVSGAGTL